MHHSFLDRYSDLDSPVHARFDDVDARGLEALVRVFVSATRQPSGRAGSHS